MKHLIPKKLILVLCLGGLSFSQASFAKNNIDFIDDIKPKSNVWSDTFVQGYQMYILKNKQNNVLRLTCNDATTEDHEHRVDLESNYYSDQNKFNYEKMSDLLFQFDSKEKMRLLNEDTKSSQGVKIWTAFIGHIKSAKQIDVFIGNQKKATFYPNLQKSKNNLTDIDKTCRPMSRFNENN